MTGYNSNSDPSTTLRRSADQKIFAGVCGGLGEHFDINAWWFRWAFIILAFFGFAGVALYILAWLLIPRADGAESVAGGWFDELALSNAGTLFGVVLIGVAALIVATSVFHISGAIVIAVALGIVGFLLYRGDLRPPLTVRITRNDDDPGSGRPSSASDEPPDASADKTEDESDTIPAGSTAAGAAASVATELPKAEKPPKVKKPRRQRSMLGRITMAVVLIAVSTMALIEVADIAHFEPVEYVGAVMAVIAVGLLVGAFIGRAMWLIIIGLLLIPVLLVAALLPKVETWSFGDPYYRPATIERVQDSYGLGFGQLTLDLTRLSPDELAEIGEIEASLGAGEMNIILPIGTGAIVRVDVGAGSIQSRVSYQEVYGALPDAFDIIQYTGQGYPDDSGIGLSRSYDLGDPPRGLVLELRVGAGIVNIRQVGEVYVNDSGDEG